MTTYWSVRGRCSAPLPADWRTALAQRLGERPRRIGVWAELALYGARRCLDDAGEAVLPDGASLWVCSLLGPLTALQDTLEQLRTDFPQPFGFLQSQPSFMLASLATQLGWRGDAVTIANRDPLALIRLACQRAGNSGALLGWVDEGAQPRSVWLRLVPVAQPPSYCRPARPGDRLDPAVDGWVLTSAGMAVTHGR